eukprot:gene2794-5639_t
MVVLQLLLLGAIALASANGQDANRNRAGLKVGSVTEVTWLPGWAGALPSRIFSGYTPSGTPPGYPNGTMNTHWVLIESERDPKKDPLVVWYQGGPGASSLYGLFVEFGPFKLNQLSMPAYNTTGIPSLISNEFSWTKLANVLVIDNPPPVGFSYCDPVGPSGKWNDSVVATSNHKMLSTWIQQMPEYAHLDMYITGESYAGIYVPTIVREIGRRFSYFDLSLALYCIAQSPCVNALCGPTNGPYWDVMFMHGHGQFSNKLYNKIKSSCTESELRSGSLSPECKSLITEMRKEIGGYYSYNLYDTCYANNVFSPNSNRKWWSSVPLSMSVTEDVGGAVNDYPCPGDALNIWVNLTQARQALNVPLSSYFFNGDNGEGMHYDMTEKNVLPFYKECIEKNKLRILVYNGDTDPGLNSFITQDKYVEYFDREGLNETEAWRPWTLDGHVQMAGYVFGYESNFKYATVRGSGHMVPQFKPKAAFALLQYFLEDKPWPAYKP